MLDTFFDMQAGEFGLNVVCIDVAENGCIDTVSLASGPEELMRDRYRYIRAVYQRALDAGYTVQEMGSMEAMAPVFTYVEKLETVPMDLYTPVPDTSTFVLFDEWEPSTAGFVFGDTTETVCTDMWKSAWPIGMRAVEATFWNFIRRDVYVPLDDFFQNRFDPTTMLGVLSLKAYKALYIVTEAYIQFASVPVDPSLLDCQYAFASDWTVEMVEVFALYAARRHGLVIHRRPDVMPFLPDPEISRIQGLNCDDVMEESLAPTEVLLGVEHDDDEDDVTQKVSLGWHDGTRQMRQDKFDALVKLLRVTVRPALEQCEHIEQTIRESVRVQFRTRPSGTKPVFRYILNNGKTVTSHVKCVEKLLEMHGHDPAAIVPKRTVKGVRHRAFNPDTAAAAVVV